MASRSAGPRATTACRPNAANSWTLGRGPYGGSSADSIGGYLDEVRISDVALAPSQFLNVIPEPSIHVAFAGLAGLALAG